MLYGFGMHILWTTVDFEQWMIDIYRFLLYLVGYITNNLIQVFLFGNGAGTFSKMVINHQIWEQTYTASRVCLDRTTAANKTISKSIGIPFEKWSTNINCSLCQIFLKGTLVGRSEIVQKCPWNTCWISHVPHVFFWGFPMETHGWFATDFSMDRRTEDPLNSNGQLMLTVDPEETGTAEPWWYVYRGWGYKYAYYVYIYI